MEDPYTDLCRHHVSKEKQKTTRHKDWLYSPGRQSQCHNKYDGLKASLKASRPWKIQQNKKYRMKQVGDQVSNSSVARTWK